MQQDSVKISIFSRSKAAALLPINLLSLLLSGSINSNYISYSETSVKNIFQKPSLIRQLQPEKRSV